MKHGILKKIRGLAAVALVFSMCLMVSVAVQAEEPEQEEEVAKQEEMPEPLIADGTEAEVSSYSEEMVESYARPSICLTEEWEVLRLVNQERISAGLSPLSTFDKLQTAGDIRANELVQVFDHTRPDGTSCFTVLDEVGAGYIAAGENIAAGYASPSAVMTGWMNSSGHRSNILDSDFTHIGIGYLNDTGSYYGSYWVQLFTGSCTPQSIVVQNASNGVNAEYGATIDSLDLVLQVNCTHGTSYLPLTSEMCTGYDSSKTGIQTVTVSYGGATTTFQIVIEETIAYRTHVQDYGWQEFVSNGAMSGTEGQAKRLEAIEIQLHGQSVSGNVEYRTHVQTYGWQDWVSNGAMSGTEGQAKRLEAIQIRLTGQMAEKYDIYYRVHSQTYGWLDWAKNGEYAGTAGFSKRLEGIEIRLVEKGGAAPGSTENPFFHVLVQYKTHVQDYGWQGWSADGAMSGTEGQSKRLEAIQLQLVNQDYEGSIRYKTHIQTYGWQDWVSDGTMSGTEGQAKRLEAIQIELTGEMAEKYDIYYRVHSQTYGWLDWAKNGAKAGTEGLSKRLEAIEIRLVEKGGAAPGNTDRTFIQ